MVKRLPKEKISLSIYVTPKCKQKLECLQQLYFMAGKRLSLSQIVEETIHYIYNTAYLCQGSYLLKILTKVSQFFEESNATFKGIDEVLTVIQSKKAATKEILHVPVSMKENVKRNFKKLLERLFR